jgi:hypothetical protein
MGFLIAFILILVLLCSFASIFIGFIFPQLYKPLFRKTLGRGKTSLAFLGITIATFVIIGIFGNKLMIGYNSSASSDSKIVVSSSPTPQTTKTTLAPTAKPIKQLDLKVINLIVKRINMDQCRYFFALRNNEDTAFPEGSTVSLGLHKLDNVWPESGSDEWKFKNPIDPQTNATFYTDSSLCPNTVEQGGIATYAYEVDDKNGNAVSKADNQSVTTEFEDLTSE